MGLSSLGIKTFKTPVFKMGGAGGMGTWAGMCTPKDGWSGTAYPPAQPTPHSAMTYMGMDMCIYITESPCSTAGINTTLYINYTSVKFLSNNNQIHPRNRTESPKTNLWLFGNLLHIKDALSYLWGKCVPLDKTILRGKKHSCCKPYKNRQ